MITVKPRVLQYMMGGLKKYITLGSMDIPVWSTSTGMYLGEGKYRYDENSQGEMKIGDGWTASYDCARWFKASVRIPEELAGKKLYLEFDFGGEALVKVNGKIIGAVSSEKNAGWLSRNQVFFNAPVAGEVFEIELEAAIDAGGFCNAAMNGAKSTSYTLSTARIVAVDPVCEGYDFDVNVVWDSLEAIEDEYIKARVYEALDNSLHTVDFDFEDARVRASIKKAAEVLR